MSSSLCISWSADGCGLALDICCPTVCGDVRPEPAGLHLVDVSSDRYSLREQWRLHDATDLPAEIGLEVAEREEAKAPGVRSGAFGDLAADRLILEREHSAAGVLDDREFVRAEQMGRNHEGADRVVGGEPACVPNDVRVAGADADDLLDGEARVHAGDDRPAPGRRQSERAAIEARRVAGVVLL